jgi:hypothetical protein
MRHGMGHKSKISFLTADHLEAQADARAREAEQFPAGEARQNALRNAAQLRVYASMKRALAPPVAKSKYQDNARLKGSKNAGLSSLPYRH